MDFSVVIPSRNRSQLIRRAINSVLEQTHPSLEVIVVNDGSDSDQTASYSNLAEMFDTRLRVIELPPLTGGHGSSYAYNRGVDAATGTYICMLGDGDCWTDPEHLARAWTCLSEVGAEVYMANQAAFCGAERVCKSMWLEPIEAILVARNARPDGVAYSVGVEDLARCGNFCHFNTTIVSRALYQRVRGMNEFIGYEYDRDFYLRMVDQAGRMLYYPGVVARHNITEQGLAAEAPTSLAYLRRMHCRTYVYDKARIGSAHSAIRTLATLHQGYTLRSIAETLLTHGRPKAAYHFAIEALWTKFSFKWTLYSLYIGVRALTGNDAVAVEANAPGNA